MVKSLINKKVLLVAPKFYEYHISILDEMKSDGALVTFIPEVNNTIFYRTVNKISTYFKSLLEHKHRNKICRLIDTGDFDYVLVIRGGLFFPEFISDLRLRSPKTKFLMYQWDSYRHSDYRGVIQYFDKVATFDINDAIELKLPYIPLFISPVYQSKESVSSIYNMVFFGAYHSDRLKVIKFMADKLNTAEMSYKFHLYIPFLSFLYRCMLGDISVFDIKFFSFYRVSPSLISQTYNCTDSVLDIELSIQSGLSIRTFEVLASGAKLITTNSKILDQDFYTASHINYINRDELSFDADFILSESKAPEMADYSIENWLNRVLFEGGS